MDRWERRTMIGACSAHGGADVPPQAGKVGDLGLLALTAAVMMERPTFHRMMSRMFPRDPLAAANGFFTASVVGGGVATVGAVGSGFISVVPPVMMHAHPALNVARRSAAW